MSKWNQQPKSFKEDWLIPLLIIVFFAGLTMPNLGKYGLFDPWETHYGEVARHMVEHQNYIDPFWGSPWDVGEVKRERAGFYSKPPLTMWLMALGIQTWGVNSWGVRFFFTLISIIALLSIYLALSRIVNRRVGILSTLFCGLSPFYSFLSHQAVPDLLLVSLVTIGMMCLCLAFFDTQQRKEKEQKEQKEQKVSPLLYTLVLGLTCLILLGQLWAIWPMDRSPDVIRPYLGQSKWLQIQWWFFEAAWVGKGKGWVLVLLLFPFCLWTGLRVAQTKSNQAFYFYLFYICCGLTVIAKGWLGWAPLGGTLVLYLLINHEWSWIKRAHPFTGLLLVFTTGHLWIIAMLGGHHPNWFRRFIEHDHINRLFLGVHSTDSGGFEYFFQWIGYGLFPLVVFLPIAFARVFVRLKKNNSSYNSAQKVELLIFLWALFGLFFLSKSSTKFHHYIFPIMPAFCILIAFWINDLWQNLVGRRFIFIASALGILFWIGQDVYHPPKAVGQSAQNWVNLFTYKYDRKWPIPSTEKEFEELQSEAISEAWFSKLDFPINVQQQAQYHPPLEKALHAKQWTYDLTYPIKIITWISAIALFMMLFLPLFKSGFFILLGSSLALSIFCTYIYLPKIAPHWSQEDLWNYYYEQCTPFNPQDKTQFRLHLLKTASRIPNQLERFVPKWCKQPIVAFRMNWRGEALYSSNTVIPILYTKDLKTFLQQWGVWDHWKPDKTFYLFTERTRVKSELEPALPKHLKGQYQEVFGKGRKFVLLKVEPTSVQSTSINK